MTSMTTAQLAELVTRHMAAHSLPEPASLRLTTSTVSEQEVLVQLRTRGLADTAAVMLAWAAASQAAVAVEAWRPPSGTSVHLDLHTTLTSDQGSADLTVYGGVPFDPAIFPGLEPSHRCPVSLGQLTAWATSAETEAA